MFWSYFSLFWAVVYDEESNEMKVVEEVIIWVMNIIVLQVIV